MKNKKPIVDWDTVPVVIDLPYAARILGCSVEALRKRAQRRQVPAHKPIKDWLFDKEELREYIRST